MIRCAVLVATPRLAVSLSVAPSARTTTLLNPLAQFLSHALRVARGAKYRRPSVDTLPAYDVGRQKT